MRKISHGFLGKFKEYEIPVPEVKKLTEEERKKELFESMQPFKVEEENLRRVGGYVKKGGPIPSPTPSPTPSVTPSFTPTSTLTPTPTFTPTASITPSITPTLTPTPSSIPPNTEIFAVGDFIAFNSTATTYNQPLIISATTGELMTGETQSITLNANITGGLYDTSIGKYYVSGPFADYVSDGGRGIVRLNTDFTRDNTYSPFDNVSVGSSNSGQRTQKVRKQSDGKIVFLNQVMNVSSGGVTYDFDGLFRSSGDTGLDLSFLPSQAGDNKIFDFDVYSNDELVVVGDFTTYRGSAYTRIVKLDNTGNVIDFTGLTPNNDVNCVGVDSSGNTYFGGDFTSVSGVSVGRYGKVTSGGTFDVAYSTAITPNSSIEGLFVQSDDKVIYWGFFGLPSSRYMRLNTDGSVDTAFYTALSSYVSNMVIVGIQEVGNKLYIAGNPTGGSYGRNGYIVIDKDTLVVTDMVDMGTGIVGGSPTAIITDGSSVVLGSSSGLWDTSLQNRFGVSDLDGGYRTDYEGLSLSNASIDSILELDSNTLIVGGDATTWNGVATNGGLNKIDKTTGNRINWTGTSISISAGDIQDIIKDRAGRILAVGNFRFYNNISTNRIVRIDEYGTRDTTFNIGSGFNNYVSKIIDVGDGYVIGGGRQNTTSGGRFSSYNGVSASGMIKLDYSGGVDSSFSCSVNNDVKAMVQLPSGKILIGGAFTSVNGDTTKKYLCLLNSDGSIDSSFTATPQYMVYDIIVGNGGLYLGGLFGNIDGISGTARFTRMNFDGSIPSGWGNSIQSGNIAYSVKYDSTTNRLYMSGNFTRLNNTDINSGMCAVNGDTGALDTNVSFGATNNIIQDFILSV